MLIVGAACAVLVSGFNVAASTTVVAWDSGSSGVTNVPPDLSNVIAISAGYYHGLALESDGTVIRWDSAETTLSGPGDVIAVTGGWDHDILVHSNGTVDVFNAM